MCRKRAGKVSMCENIITKLTGCKLVRALNHCHEARSYSTQTRHYLERTEETHAEMLSVLDTIVHRWEKLYKKVSQLNWVLSKQLGMKLDLRFEQ